MSMSNLQHVPRPDAQLGVCATGSTRDSFVGKSLKHRSVFDSPVVDGDLLNGCDLSRLCSAPQSSSRLWCSALVEGSLPALALAPHKQPQRARHGFCLSNVAKSFSVDLRLSRFPECWPLYNHPPRPEPPHRTQAATKLDTSPAKQHCQEKRTSPSYLLSIEKQTLGRTKHWRRDVQQHNF